VKPRPDKLKLTLYVSSRSGAGQVALRNLERLMKHYPDTRVDLDVVDVMKQAEIAERERVVATPTLDLLEPGPRRRLVGDLSDLERVVRELGL
jgi:circadian clock protein KaiB